MTSLSSRYQNLKTNWLSLWLIFSLPLAIFTLFRNDLEAYWLIAGQTILAIFLHFLKIPKAILKKVLLAIILLQFILLTVGWVFGTNSFQAIDKFWKQASSISIYETLEKQGHQSWSIDTTEDLKWVVEARLIEGFTDWIWGHSSKDILLERISEANQVYTRVNAPDELDAAAHISHGLFLDTPSNERRFKLILEARLNPNATKQPVLQLTGGGEWPLDLNYSWTEIEKDWTVKGNNTRELRIILKNLSGTLELNQPKLYEWQNGEWQDKGMLTGQIMRLRADTNQLLNYENFLPSKDWQKFELSIPSNELMNSNALRTTIVLAEGIKLQLKKSELSTTTGLSQKRVKRIIRQKLWYPNENIAGHSLAALGLVLLTFTSSLLTALAVFAITLISILLTGSRTALIVMFLAGMLFIFILPKKRNAQFIIATLFVITILITFLMGLDSRIFSLDQIISRSLIWRTALDAMLEYPLGLPEQNFAAYFTANHPELPTITHAHNFWLDFAVNYGVLGLLCSVFLTSAIVLRLLLDKNYFALIFVAAFLGLQLLDVSLFFNVVFFSFIIGLNHQEKQPVV